MVSSNIRIIIDLKVMFNIVLLKIETYLDFDIIFNLNKYN